MIIDAHQHVWDPDVAHYPWLTAALAPINRACTLDEVLPSYRRAGITGCILVEAEDDPADTALMEAAAINHPQVVGIVTYSPVSQPARLAYELDPQRRNPLVVGVRNLIHHHADPDWMLSPEFDDGLSVLEELGLPFDVVSALPRHLELVPHVAARHPRLILVIDHLSKPPVHGDRAAWEDLIRAAAEPPNVVAKVSGLYDDDAPATWSVDAIRPIIDHAVEVFGTSRLMYGGDWPICIRAGGYDAVWDGLSSIFDGWSTEDRERVLAGTAMETYRLDPTRLVDAELASHKGER